MIEPSLITDVINPTVNGGTCDPNRVVLPTMINHLWGIFLLTIGDYTVNLDGPKTLKT